MQTRERGPPSALAEILYQFLLQKFLLDRSLLHKYFLDKPLLNKSLVDKSLLHHYLLHKSLMNRFLMDKSLLYMSLLHKFLLYKFLLLKSFLNKFLKAWSLLMTILFTILARPLGLSDLFLLPLVYLVILWSSPTTQWISIRYCFDLVAPSPAPYSTTQPLLVVLLLPCGPQTCGSPTPSGRRPRPPAPL